MNQIRDDQERHEFAAEALSLWRITFSPLIWALHFVLLYGGTALYCARIWEEAHSFMGPQASAAGLTAIALALIAWQGWRAWRQWDVIADRDWENDAGTDEDRHQFLGHAAFLLSVISFIGVFYVALAFVFVEGCQ